MGASQFYGFFDSHELTTCLKVRAKGKVRGRKEGPDFRRRKAWFCARHLKVP